MGAFGSGAWSGEVWVGPAHDALHASFGRPASQLTAALGRRDTFISAMLLCSLQWGLKHYWDAQLDADLESDALGWQYCAGCMAGGCPPLPVAVLLVSRSGAAVLGPKFWSQKRGREESNELKKRSECSAWAAWQCMVCTSCS
jgi:hypothetical protein